MKSAVPLNMVNAKFQLKPEGINTHEFAKRLLAASRRCRFPGQSKVHLERAKALQDVIRLLRSLHASCMRRKAELEVMPPPAGITMVDMNTRDMFWISRIKHAMMNSSNGDFDPQTPFVNLAWLAEQIANFEAVL